MPLTACGESVISVETSRADGAVDLESGLLAYLPFDETTAGTLALDVSGNDHHGTPSPNPPTPSLDVPPFGSSNLRSLAFDGVEQLVDLGNPPALDVEGRVTVSAWVKPSLADGFRNIVAHGFNASPKQELALRINDEVYEFSAWNGFDHRVTAPVGVAGTGSWRHLAGTYDGRAYRLYLDGELVGLLTEAFAPMRVEASWAVGGRSTTPPVESRSYAGLIDEVRIYNRPLSDQEVRALAGL